MVFIKVYYLDNSNPRTFLCDSVDVCPDNTCIIHGGIYDNTTIYGACGAEVLLDKDGNYIEG